MRDLWLEIVHLEGGEEAQAAHVKGHDWGHGLLEQTETWIIIFVIINIVKQVSIFQG